MSVIKIAFLIPMTSRGREEAWKIITDSYFFRYTLQSTLDTNKDILTSKQYDLHFYVMVDEDDKIYSVENFKEFWFLPKEKLHLFKHAAEMRSNVAAMWNALFRIAYDDKCHYFYQCGDDIIFYKSTSKNWIKKTVKKLQKHNNVGIAGPISDGTILKLTQGMVSRVHMNIFGYFFPPSFTNFGVDEWSNYVYQPDHFYPLSKMLYFNASGPYRYDGYRYANSYSIWNFRIFMGREILATFLFNVPLVVAVGFRNEAEAQEILTGQTYMSTRIYWFPGDLHDFNSMKHVRKQVMKRFANSNAIVVFFDRFTAYKNTRIEHVVDVFHDKPQYDIVGCYSVKVRCPSKISEDDYVERIFKSSFHNEVFIQTIAFRINTWKFHMFEKSPKYTEASPTFYDRSFLNYCDYPVGLLDSDKTLFFIQEAESNPFNIEVRMLEKNLFLLPTDMKSFPEGCENKEKEKESEKSEEK